ncbi:sulfurtransferase [Streptomyces somaliensis DSM 40738]|uniref:Sulfurtransferase n=1 Tax=Streptomyces somaliensis (strain ATCC 33201 / DSM 40738 / JCM 12659 / KCTC 9044 / NCTC 11332 / NRRL B-12077 / IP 733) TaxID=1134445 RepID=A0AA44ICU3_STRE0|nr:sulfurtransferase [Streptomyces somaliensis]MCQ0024953.1 sulfurtransferase [Streptomyces somaliensis DSM 40738]NKY14020.1 sulfurtransferase [Streptomyces somaliensis DSM 40738]
MKRNASTDPHPLVPAADLAAEVASPAPGDPGLVLLDVRYELGGPPGRPAYEAGHIPGAVYVDLDTELAGAPGEGGRHPLPDLDVFGAAMRAAGVSSGSRVVVYDGGPGWAAARAWWLLRWAGHADVRVLDGGLPAWRGGLSTAVPAPAPGDFVPVPGGMPLLDAEGAAALARTGLLLDARAAERYRGEVEPIDPVAGHVPGAVSAPTTENVAEDGRFLPPEALAARFGELGALDAPAVGVYCGSGVSAAHEVLALEAVGVRAALYVGSWSEWVRDPSRPVATGPDRG